MGAEVVPVSQVPERAWPNEVAGFGEFLNGALAVSPRARFAPTAGVAALATVPKYPRCLDGSMPLVEGPNGEGRLAPFRGHKGPFRMREGRMADEVLVAGKEGVHYMHRSA